MRFSKLKKILNHEDSEAFGNIFEEGKFSYNEPVMIDQLSLYDSNDAATAKEDAERFGCRIDGNGDDVWIPAGMPFNITKSRDPYAEMVITRNGVSFYPNYVEDNEDINLEFTEFGMKLRQYACNTGTDLLNAYNTVKSIEQYFGVKITK